MPNAKRRCTKCKTYEPIQNGVTTPLGFFCSHLCKLNYVIDSANKLRIKAVEKKITNVRHKRKLNELRTRTQWYNLLQTEVNKYVRNRDINKPCCTCGTTNPSIKYDAGHCFTRAARPDIRFNLHNIHKQCSVNCNQHGSGMRHEYQLFITNKYGPNHFEWLESYHRPLKDEFPHWSDIEKEIKRYRMLNKQAEQDIAA